MCDLEPRTCIVSFQDAHNVRHSVEVSACSLYEAACLGLAAFRRCEFADAAAGRASRLTVTVKEPAISHELAVGKLEDWLTSGAKSPKERIEKDRLTQILRGA